MAVPVEALAINTFIRGLPVDIAKAFDAIKPKNLEAAYEEASRYEARMEANVFPDTRYKPYPEDPNAWEKEEYSTANYKSRDSFGNVRQFPANRREQRPEFAAHQYVGQIYQPEDPNVQFYETKNEQWENYQDPNMYINQNYEQNTYENVQYVGQIYGPPNRPENQIYGAPNGVRMAGPPLGPQIQKQYEPYRPQYVMRGGVQVQYRPTQAENVWSTPTGSSRRAKLL